MSQLTEDIATPAQREEEGTFYTPALLLSSSVSTEKEEDE